MEKINNKESSNSPIWQDDDDKKFEINREFPNKFTKRVNNYSNKGKKFLHAQEVEEQLKNNYNTLNPNFNRNFYTWADTSTQNNSNDSSQNGLNKLLLTSQAFVESNNKQTENKSKSKYNTNYNVKNVNGYIIRPDLNLGYYHNSVITNVEFSPSKENLALCSGLDKKLYFFKLKTLELDEVTEKEKEKSGKKEKTNTINSQNNQINKNSDSNLVQAIVTHDMPIHSSKFLHSNEVILSGRRKHYFCYDLEKNALNRFVFNTSFMKTDIKTLENCYTRSNCESYAFTTKEGDIFVFDSYNKQFKTNLKIHGSVNSVCFGPNHKVYCCSDKGEIYLFDIRRSNTCLNKIDDEGSFNTLGMDIDINNKYLATSLHSGVVNLYDLNQLTNNTTTQIETVKVSFLYLTFLYKCIYICIYVYNYYFILFIDI